MQKLFLAYLFARALIFWTESKSKWCVAKFWSTIFNFKVTSYHHSTRFLSQFIQLLV